MPIAATIAASAAVSAGSAIYSAGQQKKAANTALGAANDAADKSLAAQQGAFNTVNQLEQPFVQGGSLGETALLQRLGLIQPGTSASQPDPYYGYNITPQARGALTDRATAVPQGLGPGVKTGNAGTSPAVPDTGHGIANSNPAPASTAQVPDWDAFAQANPDVAQWAASGHGDPNIPIEQQSIPQRYAYWLQNAAALGDPRATASVPMKAAPPAQPQNTAAGAERTDLMTADRPTAGQVPTFARPDQGAAPSAAAYFSNFTQDPGYQFALQQGLRSANAGYAAKGLLKSDAAIKGLNDYAQGMAAQQYGNWFNRQDDLYKTSLNQFNSDRANSNQNFENDRGYGTNLYLNQRDFANNNFNTDRSYETSRYDTNTGNLFDIANMGQRGAAAVGGAGQTYADNAGSIYGSRANAAADAAYSRGAANAGAAGSVAGAASNIFSAFAGGYGGSNPGSTLGTVNYGNALNASNIFGNSAYKPGVF